MAVLIKEKEVLIQVLAHNQTVVEQLELEEVKLRGSEGYRCHFKKLCRP